MKSFKDLAESDREDVDDLEEYDLEEFYIELMEDIDEDFTDLKEIMKQLGISNEVASPLNEIRTILGKLDDIIKESIADSQTSIDTENEGKW